MQLTWAPCLGWHDPLEEEITTPSFSILAWRIPWTQGPGGLQSISSIQFSRSVVSDSLWPHALQHARLPCPSPTPGVYSDSCPFSRWCHPTISSSVIPFFFCPQSFPAPGSFQMSQLFASRGQTIGVSASTSVLPINTQDWSPFGWTGWISLQSTELWKVRHNQVIKQIHTADSEEKNINSGLSHIHRSFPLAPGYHGASLSSSNVFILTSWLMRILRAVATEWRKAVSGSSFHLLTPKIKPVNFL